MKVNKVIVWILSTVMLFGTIPASTVLAESSDASCSKTRSTYYKAEEVAAARQNVAKYDWAKNLQYTAVQKAEKFLGIYSDEALWKLVSPQSLGRTILVDYPNFKCPICGKVVTYDWKADPENHPWKIQCLYCQSRFPSNDFKAYYESGLDANGIFNPNLADKLLLKNELYPDKSETWGVDDGYGWIDENGSKYLFIAYYNHWKLWYGGEIENALLSFRDAYLYTGELKYARAGIILLDRIADVYPEMDLNIYPESDGYINSDGGTGKGKIIGSIWETVLAKSFISAYDAFFPAMEDADHAGVVGFLSQKALQYTLDNPKSTITHIKKNIEDGIIRQIYPAVKEAKIRGNSGMHESTLAMAAVVLDDPACAKEWIDFIYQTGDLVSSPDWHITGGNILNTLVNDVDRDGFGNEASPHYNSLWLDQFKIVADVLDGYDGYPEADLYNNVKFRKMFYTGFPLRMIEKYIPTIGDTYPSGKNGVSANMDYAITAFKKYRDPVFAQLAYYLNGNKVDGLHENIFSNDPYEIASDIQEVINQYGTIDHLDSVNLTGFGFAALRDGKNYSKEYGTKYNFIKMTPAASTQGTIPDSRDNTIQFEAKGTGDYISYNIQVPKDGLYELQISGYRCGSYGIYDIFIDDAKAGTFDFYKSPSGYFQLEKVGNLQLAEGNHQIKFVVAGKDANSTNYKMAVIQLYMVTPEEIEEMRVNSIRGDRQRDMWLYYGRNSGHGHSDNLNLGLHGYGLDLAPDLGYPEQTGANPTRLEWVNNTISHNTVVVDKRRQAEITAGIPQHYEDSSVVKMIDVESPSVYPQTQLYRRTAAMIKIDDANSYTVDFFRVKGGNDHYYSFHAAEGDVTTKGLELVSQLTGTYAGPDVEYGKCPDDDDENPWVYNGSGFHYLRNVKRDENPEAGYSVDWKVEDTWGVLEKPEDIHVRLTMLNETDDVAIADGNVPQISGNPENLKYLIAHRNGQNLESQFVSVIEPYKNQRSIKAIEGVSMIPESGNVSESDAYAVKLIFENGRIDYVINTLNTDVRYCVDNKLYFKGSFGVYSEIKGKAKFIYVSDGTYLSKGNSVLLENEAGRLIGKVSSFTGGLSTDNEITVTLDGLRGVQPESLVGRYLYIENDGVRNAAYQIKQIKAVNDSTVTFGIGDITLVRSWADNYDYSKGYVYDIQENADVAIPLSYFTINSSEFLKELRVNGTPVPGFNKDIYEYTVNLPAGTSQVPEISAEAEDITAQVDITNAGTLDKSSTVTVTTLDGRSTAYKIYYNIAAGSLYKPAGIN